MNSVVFILMLFIQEVYLKDQELSVYWEVEALLDHIQLSELLASDCKWWGKKQHEKGWTRIW